MGFLLLSALLSLGLFVELLPALCTRGLQGLEVRIGVEGSCLSGKVLGVVSWRHVFSRVKRLDDILEVWEGHHLLVRHVRNRVVLEVGHESIVLEAWTEVISSVLLHLILNRQDSHSLRKIRKGVKKGSLLRLIVVEGAVLSKLALPSVHPVLAGLCLVV